MNNHTESCNCSQCRKGKIIDPVIDGKKICTKCRKYYFATNEFFQVDSRRSIGLSNYCKSCKTIQGKKDWDKHKDKRNSKRRERRKDDSAYRNHANKVNKIWIENNHGRHLENKRRSYWNHRDKNIEKMRRRRENPEFVEKKRITDREYSKNHRKENIERNRIWSMKHRDRINHRRREVYKIDPIIRKMDYLRYESTKRSLEFDFSKEDEQKAVRYFEGKCAVCGREPDKNFMLVMDHWIPLIKGGGSTKNNLVPLCHRRFGRNSNDVSCNLSKRDADPIDWLIWRFGEKEAEMIFDRVYDYFDWMNS